MHIFARSRHFIAGMVTTKALVCAVCVSSLAHAEVAAKESVDRRWLERLPASDRGPIDALIGYAPPAFDEKLSWVNVDEPPTWQNLRERVVLIQSWTSSNEIGRRWLTQARDAVSDYAETDVVLIALHTPDAHENAKTFLERREISTMVAVDASGEFCDALGVYRRPVNILVDRNGAVRYAGLNADGLAAALEQLVNEPPDPTACVEPHSTGASNAAFPPISGQVRSARDIRGQQAPPFHVEQWITAAPSMHGKVVMLDFWATWCGPCISSIPRLNQYAERFSDDMVIIGVSNESQSAFDAGMSRRNLSLNGFKYALALDPGAQMQSAIAIRGIPHVTIMCSDWIVRWQGHPGSLNEQLLSEIIQANNGGSGSPMPGRWQSR
jgi:cytochrome c biogenesis protein CcmG/thiol:disulfide interchange protein DsbE